MVLQVEAAECALACLAMVTGYHGRHLSLLELRQRGAVSQRGAGLGVLIAMAESEGLRARALRAELAELRQLRCPAVLHWELDHFVVLRKFDLRGRAVIHNPALGVRRYPLDELSRRFSGIALELTPSATFERKAPARGLSLRTLLRGAAELGPALAQIVLLSLMIQCFALGAPFYLQIVVDDVLVRGDVDLLGVVTLGFLLLLVVRVATRALRDWVTQHAAVAIGLGLSVTLFRHLLKLPAEYFARRRVGDVISRFESLRPVQAFLTDGAVGAVVDGLLAVSTLALMLVYSPLLSAIVLACFAGYLVLRLATFVLLKDRSEASLGAGAALDSQFVEILHGISSVKAAGRELEVSGAWTNRLVDAKNAELRVARLGIVFETGRTLLAGVENLLVVFVGAKLVLGGAFTIGMLYAFVAFKNHFAQAVIALIDETVRFRMLGLHLGRISDITGTRPEPGADGRPALHPVEAGDIALEDVWYRYAESERYVVRGFHLEIARGERVCLRGPSGCGKSTLLKLAVGLIPPARGTVRIGGRRLTGSYAVEARRRVAVVTQEDVLFSASVLENVTLFDLEPDLVEVERACRLAHVHDEVVNLPMGYETRLGQLGSALSAGQRQRLLLARALYRRPWLLVLDEATAHLDAHVEERILAGIAALPVTCLIATHSSRPAAVLGAREVVIG